MKEMLYAICILIPIKEVWPPTSLSEGDMASLQISSKEGDKRQVQGIK